MKTQGIALSLASVSHREANLNAKIAASYQPQVRAALR